MTARHSLDQIERGLDGVTAGEWYTGCLGSDSKCQCSYVLSEGYTGAICTVHIGNGLPIGEGGNDAPPAEEAAANMRHIARCSPDTMREIAAYVRELEARATAAEATVTALQEKLAKADEALERLSGGEALTNSFYVKDNSEGKELRARMDFAQAALLNLRSKP